MNNLIDKMKKYFPVKAIKYMGHLKRYASNIGNYERQYYHLPVSGTRVSFIKPKGHPWFDTIPEEELVKEFELELSQNSIFYDIGAHFGFHSVAAKAIGGGWPESSCF